MSTYFSDARGCSHGSCPSGRREEGASYTGRGSFATRVETVDLVLDVRIPGWLFQRRMPLLMRSMGLGGTRRMPSAADLDLESGLHAAYSMARGPPLMAAQVIIADSCATMELTLGS